MSLFGYDTSLQMKERDILYLLGKSKITNAEQTNRNSPFKFDRIRLAELIDLIGAVAEFNFKGSELEVFPLTRKIEFIL